MAEHSQLSVDDILRSVNTTTQTEPEVKGNDLSVDDILRSINSGDEPKTDQEDKSGLVQFAGTEKDYSTADDAPPSPNFIDAQTDLNQAVDSLERDKRIAAATAPQTPELPESGFAMPKVDLGLSKQSVSADTPLTAGSATVKSQIGNLLAPKQPSLIEADFSDFTSVLPYTAEDGSVRNFEGQQLDKATIRSFFAKDKDGAYTLPNGKKIYSDALFEKYVDEYYKRYNHPILMQDEQYRRNYIMRNFGKTEEQFIADATAQLNAQLDRIEEAYIDVKKQNTSAKDMRAEAWRDAFSESAPYKPEDAVWRAIGDAKKKINSISKDNFWTGFAETFSIDDIAAFGLPGLMTAANQLNALNKYIEGKPLTAEEKLFVEVSKLSQDLDQFRGEFRSDSGMSWNRVGNIVGFMPQFAVQLGITGSIIPQVGQKAVKDITVKTVMNTLKESVGKGLAMAGKKIGIAAANDAIGTSFMTMSYKNLADRRLRKFQWDGESLVKEQSPWAVDLAKALGETFVERHSEQIGMWITDGLMYGGKKLAQAKFLDNAFGRGVRQAMNYQLPPVLEQLRKNLRVGGYIGEVGSEIYNNLINPFFTGETDSWKELLTSKYYWELCTSMAISTGAFYSLGIPSYVKQARAIRDLNQSRSKLFASITSQPLKDLLLTAFASDNLEVGIGDLAAVDWKSISKQDAQAASEYIFKTINAKLLDEEIVEAERLQTFLPMVQNVSASLYSGANIASPEMGTQLRIASLKDGSTVYMQVGDIQDANTTQFIVRTETGEQKIVGRDDIVLATSTDMSDYIAQQYNLLFSDSINKEKLRSFINELQTAQQNNASQETIGTLFNRSGYILFDKGEQVTLTNGTTGIVVDHADGHYLITDPANPQITTAVGFLNIMQPDPAIAEVQAEVVKEMEESPAATSDVYVSEEDILTQKLEAAAQDLAAQDGDISIVRLADGREATVKQGNIVTNPDGSINTELSDETIVIKVADSAELQQISVDEVDAIVEQLATVEAVEMAKNNIEEQLTKRNLINSILEQNGVVDVILIGNIPGQIVEALADGTYAFNWVGEDNAIHTLPVTIDQVQEVLPPQTEPVAPEETDTTVSTTEETNVDEFEKLVPVESIDTTNIDWDNISAQDYLNISVTAYGADETLKLSRTYYQRSAEKLQEANKRVEEQNEEINRLNAQFAELSGPAEATALRQQIREAEVEKARREAAVKQIEQQMAKYEYAVNELEKKKTSTVAQDSLNNNNFAENNDTDGRKETNIRRDNIPSLEAGADNSSRVDTVDATEASFLEQSGDNISAGRGDIRVFEQGLGSEHSKRDADSERDIQRAVSQRLVEIAQENGLFIPLADTKNLGKKYSGRTGESTVYIAEAAGKVYKVKNPYAKSALKKVAPQDAIYEHIVHNLLFPEAPYKFEGISKDVDGVRIVLSQPFIENKGSASQSQIEQALAARGLYPDGRYSYGNDYVSVTDVEGDNVILGEDGTVYFIDPIIKFKKPATEIIEKLSEQASEIAPLMIGNFKIVAPEGTSAERWAAVVEHLKEIIGADNVITNAEQMREVLDYLLNEEGYQNGNGAFSMSTYAEEGRQKLVDYVNDRVDKGLLAKADADAIVQQMDDIYAICEEYKDKYAPFGEWSDAAVTRDEEGKPVFSVIKKNGEYAMNLDFSLVCKKRRTLDAVFRRMIDRGIISNYELGQVDVAKINDIIRRFGFETACRLCFVDAKRFRVAQVADVFCEMYNPLTDLNEEQLRAVIAKEGNTTRGKVAKMLIEHPENRVKLSRANFMESKGFENMTVNREAIMKLYNMKKGTGGPKASYGDTQYVNDILGKQWTPEDAYAVGGVRLQSFSDYVPRMVFDYIQMVADLAAKNLPVHSYTKEVLFAQTFGLTGIKINLSLVPKVVEGGIAAGLDANGDYVWQEGETFPYEEAIAIQNAEGYRENCGTIAVGVSDAHILKLLGDDNIRMVIPYHKSGLNKAVAIHNNIDQFTDYTNEQNTRQSDGTKLTEQQAKAHFNFNEELHRLGNPRLVAEKYLEWCDQNGYIPKFDQFRDHPNYYKLLEDFTTCITENGVDTFVPQGPVQMNFPTEQSAFGSLSSLIEKGLEEDAVLEGQRNSQLDNIVDTIENELGNNVADTVEDADLSTFRKMKTSKGEVYGFTYKGKIYLDPTTLNLEAPVHEYTELWCSVIEKQNPLLWAKGKELLRQTITWQQVNNDPNYRHLSEDLRASETLSRIVAAEAARKINEISDSKTLIAKLRAWIRKFWNELKATFSQWTKEDISKLTLREFKAMPFRDLIEKIDPRKYQTEGGNALAASIDATELNEIRAERKQIEEQAKANGTWLKAPNGQPTNLTPEQWVTVRTRRFKEWFGDWLRAIMEVPIISASKEHGFINFKEARKWAKENLVGDYNNPEIGSIHISGLAIDKYLSAPAVTKSINKDIHLSTLRVLPRILENSFIGEIHEDRDYDANIKDIVRLFGCVNINGVSYRVKTTVKRYNDNGAKSKAYSYEVTEIELLDGSGIPHTQSADFIPTSNNSITLAKLLKGVKKNNSSEYILSVSQIVDANGEPMPVYHGTIRKGLRKFNSFDTAKPAWFAYHKDYAEIYNRTSSLFKFSDLYSVFLNIREPLIIPSVNYSFLDEKEREIIKSHFEQTRIPFNDVQAIIDEIRPAELWQITNTEQFKALAEKYGYDGISTSEGIGNYTYAAFSPNQIKSVDNTGTFDSAESDIRYSQLSAIDAEYMDAVRSGDMERAKELVRQYAETRGYTTTQNFRDAHSAPTATVEKKDFTNAELINQQSMDDSSDVNLFSLPQGENLAPNDFWSPQGPRWYGYNNDAGMQAYTAIASAIRSINYQLNKYGEVRDIPTVKVYRAVPTSVEATALQNGDWVTPSKLYADRHGAARFGFDEYKIIEQEVPATELWWDGNDAREWGYDNGNVEATANTPNNVKLLDPITYDNDGNIIPLSSRFDQSVEDPRFMFVGEKGAAAMDAAEEATIRLDNLAVAREMESVGKDAKSIKLATGWERGADGKWRYEVPDVEVNQNAMFTFKNDGSAVTILSSLVNSEELFAAYPELEDMPVVFREMEPDMLGGYYDTLRQIHLSDVFLRRENPELNTKQEISGEDAIAHEIQHAIQDIEGFARGGSWELRRPDTDEHKHLREAVRGAISFVEFYQNSDIAQTIREAKKYNWAQWESIGPESQEILLEYLGRKRKVDYKDLREYLSRAFDMTFPRKYGKNGYRKFAGEVEARNVEARMNMTPEQRRESLASETQDVATEDQIFLYSSMGVSEKRGVDSNDATSKDTAVTPKPKTQEDKLQAKIADLRAELNDRKKNLKSTLLRIYDFLTSADILNAMETGVDRQQYRAVVKNITTAIEQSYGKTDLTVVRGIVDKYLWRIEDTMARVLAHRRLNELTKVLNTAVEGYTPQGVRFGKRIDDNAREVFKLIRDNISEEFVEETTEDNRRKPVKYRLKNRNEDGDISTSYRLKTSGRIADLRGEADDILAELGDVPSTDDVVKASRLLYIANILDSYDRTLEINEQIGQVTEEIADLDNRIKQTSAAHRAAPLESQEKTQLWDDLKAMRFARESAVQNRAQLRKNYAAQLKTFVETLNALIEKGTIDFKAEQEGQVEEEINWRRGIYRSIKDPSVKVLPNKEYTKQGKKKPRRSAKKIKRGLINENLFIGTFANLSKDIDIASIPGYWLEDGFYYQFMLAETGYMYRSDWRYRTEKKIMEQVEAKVKSIFGKTPLGGMLKAQSTNALNVISHEAQKESGFIIHQLAIRVDDKGRVVGGYQENIPLTIANLLYIRNTVRQRGGKSGYVVWGISETRLDEIVEYVESKYPEYCRFADYVVNDLLPELYEMQDAIYFKRFGTHLTQTQFYFPIVRDKRFVGKLPEVGEGEVVMPSSVTGNIVERVKTSAKMDLSADMFAVLRNHIKETLDWCAYSELTRKFNMLSTSRAFRNMMEAQDFSAEKIKQMYEIAIGQGKINSTDETTMTKALNSISKSLVAGNLTFNLNAAIKQVISMTAILGYTADPKFLPIWAKNYLVPSIAKLGVAKVIQMINEGTLNPVEALDYKKAFDNWQWGLENIPTLRARWESRNAGFEVFKAEGLDRWDKVVKWITNIGLTPNAFIDLLTCANGARSVYEYQYAENIKKGLPKEQAHKDACVKAAVCVNETQQSGLDAFLSSFQAGGGFARIIGVGLGAYQNTSMSFARNEHYAAEQIFRMLRATTRQRMIDTKIEEYKTIGYDYEHAKRLAEKDFWLSFRSQVNSLLHNGVISNFAWTLGGTLSSILAALFAGTVDWDEWNKFWDNEAVQKQFASIFSLSTLLWQFPLVYNHPIAKQILTHLQALRNGQSFGNTFESPVSSEVDDLLEVISKQLMGVIDENTGETKKQEPIKVEQTLEYIVWAYALKTGTTLNQRILSNIASGIKGMIEDGVDTEDIMNILSSPRGLTRAVAGEPREGESQKEYLDRMSFVYRMISAGTGDYDSKWQRERIKEYVWNKERPMYTEMGIDPLEVKALDSHKKAISKSLLIQRSGKKARIKDGKVEAYKQLSERAKKYQTEMLVLSTKIGYIDLRLERMIEFDTERATLLRQRYDLEKELYNKWQEYQKL